jgi:LacI family transcriptional regulator, galactose operon repressor
LLDNADVEEHVVPRPNRSKEDLNPRRPTVKDVARQAGVSTATVSRVLSGTNAVDDVLAERVRAACAALHYRPNSAARALVRGTSAIIGLLVTEFRNPFFMDIVHGVEDVTQEHGYLLVLCNSKEDQIREGQYIELMCAEQVAGAIVVPTTDRKPILTPLVDSGIPVVCIDRRVRDRPIDTVLIDNTSAAEEAVRHLIGNGYRRIGLVTGPDRTTTARERLEGYRRALHGAGITPDPALERRGPFTEDCGRQLTSELLALTPVVEALLIGNNRLMQGALDAIHAHGLRIPDDLAVVGFDDAPWMTPGSVSLTTVMQPAYELGSTAALRLIQRLKHPDQLTRQETVLTYRLRIGDSSRPRQGEHSHPDDPQARRHHALGV